METYLPAMSSENNCVQLSICASMQCVFVYSPLYTVIQVVADFSDDAIEKLYVT